jgi:hypothetical protein
MGLLRSIETGIERVVDGTVGRVVRVAVQPVEIARKLAKELEDGKTESGGRTFVPSQYTVYLPKKDRERFSEYEASLRVELGAYLAEHVRREGYTVLARPRVTFETADELASGTFGIATEPESPADAPARRIQAEPIPAAPPEVLAPPAAAVLDTPMFAPPLPDIVPAVSADPVELEVEPAPVAEIAPAEAPAPQDEPSEGPGLPEVGLPSFPTPAPSAAIPAPAPFLPVSPSLPLPLPSPPVPSLPDVPVAPEQPAPTPAPVAQPAPEPDPDPEPPYFPDRYVPEPYVPEPIGMPEPIEATQTVSAAEAARAGLAHTADTLVVDGRRYTLTGPVTSIGRSSGCDVALDDASASRRHAELRRRGGNTVLYDLDSTNGTLVNGRKVHEAPLRAGDRITIGTTTIVFERAS